MSKDRISITLSSNINTMVENMSKLTGTSKSRIVENALEFYLKTKLDEDSKALSKVKFDDLPSEDDWLTIMS